MKETLSFLSEQEPGFRMARLPSLYSDFNHLKTTNLDGYNANIITWQNGLAKATMAGMVPGNTDRLVLTTGDCLLEALETDDFGCPSALTSVIEDAVARCKMIPVDEFMVRQNSIYDDSWSLRSKRLFHWGVQQIGLGAGATTRSKSKSYVLISNLEEAGSIVMSLLRQKQTRATQILPMDLFERDVSRALNLAGGISKPDLSCLLKFLSRDKNQLTYEGEVVKISMQGQLVERITVKDKDIASIEKTFLRLTEQVEALVQSIESHSKAAREAVLRKNRSIALRHLRSKKLREEMLARRSLLLTQIEEARAKIDEASDQVDFVKAMKQTTTVLRALNAESGGVEKVASILQSLDEERAKSEEMNSLLRDLPVGYSINEREIDQELDILEANALGSGQDDPVEVGPDVLEAKLAALENHPTTNPQGSSLEVDSEGPFSEAMKRLSLDEATKANGRVPQDEARTPAQMALSS